MLLIFSFLLFMYRVSHEKALQGDCKALQGDCKAIQGDLRAKMQNCF